MHDNTYVHSLVKLSQTNPSMRNSLVKIADIHVPYVSTRDTVKNTVRDELGNLRTYRNWANKGFDIPESVRGGSVRDYLDWMDRNTPGDAKFGRRLTPLTWREKLHPANWLSGAGRDTLHDQEYRYLTGRDHSFIDLTKNPGYVPTPEAASGVNMTLAAKVELDRRRGLTDDQIKAIHNLEDLPESPFATRNPASSVASEVATIDPSDTASSVRRVAPLVEGADTAQNLVSAVNYNPNKLVRNLDLAVKPVSMLAGLGIAGAVGRSLWRAATEDKPSQQYAGKPGDFGGPGYW